eukprot:scaffold113752_cov17-Prasinocladus_malaysianus.AAC.1
MPSASRSSSPTRKIEGRPPRALKTRPLVCPRADGSRCRRPKRTRRSEWVDRRRASHATRLATEPFRG